MKTTVLIVDDHRSLLECFRATLSAQYEVRLATTVEEVYEQLTDGNVDIVVLDLHMKPRVRDWSGFEILKSIRRNQSDPIGVIMCTVDDDIETVVEGMKLGADYFLSKNLSDEELLTTISKVTEIVRLRKNLSNVGNLELKANRLEKLAAELANENEDLKMRIEQLFGKRKYRTVSLDLETYKTICGATAHSLKGEFVHIGHSLKSLRELTGNSSDIQDECDIIERSIQYSQILLRRLLDYLDTGKPRLEAIDIVELLKKAESLARPRLQSNIQLKITIDHSIKQQIVSANFEQLMSVLFELIYNAVNALRHNGGIIELHCKASDHEIAISVKDSGPGIPDNIKKYLFKKQVASKNGLGIGLFFSKKIITAMNGKLNFKTSNDGTTFTVLLPTINNK